MAEAAAVRKQVRAAIERARRAAAARRTRTADAEKAWETFLEELAVPAIRQLANVLRAEGATFEVQTPAGAVHLVSDRNREDRLQLELDGTSDPPAPIITVRRARGGRLISAERPLAAGIGIGAISEDVLIAELLEALTPWFE